MSSFSATTSSSASTSASCTATATASRKLCHYGFYGPYCSPCPGQNESLICSGHGVCDGSGTLTGTGKCTCDAGYRGSDCTIAPFDEDYAAVIGLLLGGAFIVGVITKSIMMYRTVQHPGTGGYIYVLLRVSTVLLVEVLDLSEVRNP